MDYLNLFKKVFSNPVLRNKIFYTLFILVIFRILANIPTADVNTQALSNIFNQNQFLGLVNVLSGGSYANFALIALGIAPYVIVSSILPFMRTVIPKIDEMYQNGNEGQRQIVMISRYLTFPFAVIQAIAVYLFLQSQGLIYSTAFLQVMTFIVSTVAGTFLLLWLSENISEDGVGQGVSFIIAVNILSIIPHALVAYFSTQNFNFINVIVLVVVIFLLLYFVTLYSLSLRKIPTRYSGKVVQSNDSYISIPVGAMSVMPPYFGNIVYSGVLKLLQLLSLANNASVRSVSNAINNYIAPVSSSVVILIIFTFIISYLYVGFAYDYKGQAKSLQKGGVFIPGIRPGTSSEIYIGTILYRVVFYGAVFLSIFSITPTLLNTTFPSLSYAISGVGLVIIVGTFIQIVDNFRSQVSTFSYDKFIR